MKVKNLNNSSTKTRKLIKKTFMEMLSEKKEISKISVSELVQRAEISRSTFYSHFDDIYGVVEEFENELIDEFVSTSYFLEANTYELFFEKLFEFLKSNDNNYKIICKSDDFLVEAKKLTTLSVNKLISIAEEDTKIVNRKFIELEISVFIQGLLLEYVKYCRGLNKFTLEDLTEYGKDWYEKFVKERY